MGFHGELTDLIQHHADWASDCYRRYLTFHFAEKLSVSESIAIKIFKQLKKVDLAHLSMMYGSLT